MSTRIWHSGPPPHVGWWNASVQRDDTAWRWWNGAAWSMAVGAEEDKGWVAAMTAKQVISRAYTKNIKWTDYWPEGARVPRVRP